jgi:hypothetical protein
MVDAESLPFLLFKWDGFQNCLCCGISYYCFDCLKVHLHNGEIRVKLVGFKEQKKYLPFLKPTNLARFCQSVNTA